MKIFQALAVLFLVVCVLSTMGEAGRRRRGRGRKRKSETGLISVSPGSGCKCKARKGENCFDLESVNDVNVTGSSLEAAESFDSEEVETKLESTRKYLDYLFLSVKNLTDKLSLGGRDNPYEERRTAELIPTESVQLTSDEKSKVLGQMTYWLNWIRASLRVLETLAGVKDCLGLRVSVEELNSTISAAREVQRLLNLVWSKVGGHNEKNAGRKKKDPLQCQKIRVKMSNLTCSDVRSRSYIVLRDVRRAVDKMRKLLNSPECNVNGSKEEGFSLGCQLQSVFYPKIKICLTENCDLHEWKCVSPKKRRCFGFSNIGADQEDPGSITWMRPFKQLKRHKGKRSRQR